MPRVKFIKKSYKAYPEFGIEKGDSYYYWKFNYGAVQKSKTKPRPQQLTRSAYQIGLYDIDDMKQALNTESGYETLCDELDSIKDSVQGLLDQCKESFDNIPEQLQDSCAAGCTLSERIESLESYHSELESIELEDGDEETLQNAIDEIQGAEPC